MRYVFNAMDRWRLARRDISTQMRRSEATRKQMFSFSIRREASEKNGFKEWPEIALDIKIFTHNFFRCWPFFVVAVAALCFFFPQLLKVSSLPMCRLHGIGCENSVLCFFFCALFRLSYTDNRRIEECTRATAVKSTRADECRWNAVALLRKVVKIT